MELTTKEWNNFLDRFLIENIIDDVDLLTRLNDYQRYALNEFKKSMLRIKNK